MVLKERDPLRRSTAADEEEKWIFAKISRESAVLF